MATKPINQQFQQGVTLDANGNGSAQITSRADFLLQRTRWLVQGGSLVNGAVKQSTVESYINDVPFEGSQSGNNDQSGSIRLLTTQSTITAVWTDGPPGGAATLYVWGLEYPAGQGMAALTEGAGALSGGTGPGNPILGGTTLIRDAIHSSDFVTGVSGWTINSDGSFEFGPGGTFRGNIHVSGPDGSAVDIQNDGSHAEIDLTPPSYTPATIISLPANIGAGANGTGSQSFGSLDISSPQPGILPNFGARAFISLLSGAIDGSFGPAVIVEGDSIQLGTGPAQVTKVSGTLLVNNVDQGKGWVNGVSSITDSASVAGGTETVVLTIPSGTYEAGRAFEIRHSAVVTASVASANNFGAFQVRKTNLAGTAFRNLGRTPAVGLVATGFNQNRIFITAGAVTAAIVLTLNGPGAVNLVHGGSAVFPREINIYDIGDAAKYPNAPLFT